MNWGKSIVVVFVLFALFIGTLVTVCVRQDVSLVAPDYYKQELVYQQRIDQQQNTAQLEAKPIIVVANNQLQVSFVSLNQIEKGELKLFRPSDAQQDKVYELKSTTDLVQTFDVSAQQRGMYKARLSWTMDGKEYFMEETIYI
jgi:hypothetical protein